MFLTLPLSRLVSRLARQTGANRFARTFSNRSHVVAWLYAQLVHVIGLDDVCDRLHLHTGPPIQRGCGGWWRGWGWTAGRLRGCF